MITDFLPETDNSLTTLRSRPPRLTFRSSSERGGQCAVLEEITIRGDVHVDIAGRALR
jgi:hypothetical protein